MASTEVSYESVENLEEIISSIALWTPIHDDVQYGKPRFTYTHPLSKTKKKNHRSKQSSVKFEVTMVVSQYASSISFAVNIDYLTSSIQFANLSDLLVMSIPEIYAERNRKDKPLIASKIKERISVTFVTESTLDDVEKEIVFELIDLCPLTTRYINLSNTRKRKGDKKHSTGEKKRARVAEEERPSEEPSKEPVNKVDEEPMMTTLDAITCDVQKAIDELEGIHKHSIGWE